MQSVTLIRAIAVILITLPGVTLGWFALPHFQNGLARDAAIPVPTYMVRQIQMPFAAYRGASKALSRASLEDGDAQIAYAEATVHAGAIPESQIRRLEGGVSDEPAEPRGWTLLSEALRPVDRARAAAALSQALILAPYDYWLAGARAEDAAIQWNDLDSDTRAMALRQVQLLWDDESLRGNIRPLLASPGGAALLTRAFADRPDDLRTLNRWLSHERFRADAAP